jgi:hypothetical protein
MLNKDLSFNFHDNSFIFHGNFKSKSNSFRRVYTNPLKGLSLIHIEKSKTTQKKVS